MHKPLPLMTEPADTLKLRLQREHDGRKKPRLQMLYLLARGQAQSRREVAPLLGSHRNTPGHWLALYEAGDLEAWLAVYVPAGKPLSLPPGVLAAIEQALRQPAGFASSEALRPWVQQTFHLEVNYHTLHTIVQTRFKAKLKVPRPSHTKKPLRPFPHVGPPVRSSCSVPCPRRIPARRACSARMKAVWDYSPCAADG